MLLLGVAFVATGSLLAVEASSRAIQSPLRTLYDPLLSLAGRDAAPVSPVIIDGRLRRDATPTEYGASLNVEVERAVIDRRADGTSGGIRVSVGGTLVGERIDAWRAGRRVRMPVLLRRPARYLNPGVADQERRSAVRGTVLLGSVKSAALVDVVAAGHWLAEAAASARAAVRRVLTRTVGSFSARSAGIVTAILIGDRAGLDTETEQRLQEAGTYHVIAISGGNIAILAGLLLLACKAGGVAPRLAAGITMVSLLAYAYLVGSEASVVRATFVAVVFLAARAVDHRTPSMNGLALAALVIVSAKPLVIFDAGFALTFGATLAILIGVPRLVSAGRRTMTALSRRDLRWIDPLLALPAATICAEAALMSDQRGYVLSRELCRDRLELSGDPVDDHRPGLGPRDGRVGSGSRRSCGDGRLRRPPSGDRSGGVDKVRGRGALAGRAGPCASSARRDGLLRRLDRLALAPWTARGSSPRHDRHSGGHGLDAGGVAGGWRVGILLAAAWPDVGAEPGGDARAPECLSVTFLDVGQADAELVRLPNRRSLLVDTGGSLGGGFDVGSRIVAPALWALGVRRLDYLVLTHGDPDHIGGAAAVLRDFRPREVWERVLVPNHQPMSGIAEQARAQGAAWRALQFGDALRIGDVRVRVLHPSPPDWERQRVQNDDSLVLELRLGEVSLLLTGDIGREVEPQIGSRLAPVRLRVVKVLHHGSRNSSSTEFVDATRPIVAVVSAGRANRFGHPAPSIVQRYREAGASLFRTDQHGAITVETDGHQIRVRTTTGETVLLGTGN